MKYTERIRVSWLWRRRELQKLEWIHDFHIKKIKTGPGPEQGSDSLRRQRRCGKQTDQLGGGNQNLANLESYFRMKDRGKHTAVFTGSWVGTQICNSKKFSSDADPHVPETHLVQKWSTAVKPRAKSVDSFCYCKL